MRLVSEAVRALLLVCMAAATILWLVVVASGFGENPIRTDVAEMLKSSVAMWGTLWLVLRRIEEGR